MTMTSALIAFIIQPRLSVVVHPKIPDEISPRPMPTVGRDDAKVRLRWRRIEYPLARARVRQSPRPRLEMTAEDGEGLTARKEGQDGSPASARRSAKREHANSNHSGNCASASRVIRSANCAHAAMAASRVVRSSSVSKPASDGNDNLFRANHARR